MRQSKWYIKIDGKKEGPYTRDELRDHPFVTPFTLAQKKVAIKGKKAQWRMMGQIAALKGLFQKTHHVEKKKHGSKPNMADVLVGSTGTHLSSILIWSVLTLLAILFIMFSFTSHGR